MRKPSLGIIFLTVFVDLVGFGLVLPLLPNYSRAFGASGFQVGLIMASYSLMQFLFAPAWGALSDRIGRRPVLLTSTAVATLSYATFAAGSMLTGTPALLVILSSRIVAGICGANITVAQAYIADITPPEDRSRRMGLIGMAFGLGFIVGPAMAVGAQELASRLGASKPWIAAAPGCVASALCLLNFLSAWVRLPESWTPGTKPSDRRTRWDRFTTTLSKPTIGFLILTFFLATFGFTCFESTLGLLIQLNFGLPDQAAARTNAILFSYAGLIGAFVQAGPIGRLLKKLGEARLVAGSLVVFGISMVPLPFIHGSRPLAWEVFGHAEGLNWITLLLVVGGLAVGSGLTRPPLFGLLSRLTPADEQGATLGIAQSAGALARVFGPPFAGYLFDRSPSSPYWICGSLAVLTGIVAWRTLVGLPLSSPAEMRPPGKRLDARKRVSCWSSAPDRWQPFPVFRPCIDLRGGRVVQIVGGSLTDTGNGVRTNFEADHPPEWFAARYREDDLRGGHVIALGPGNEDAAKRALGAWPGGLQYGGGVTAANARAWLDAGASHVIVTSWVFREGRIDWGRLEELLATIGRDRLVLDLSCRVRDGAYWVVTDRWQNFTEERLDGGTFQRLAGSCAEFLVHAVDVEGLCRGIDPDLVRLLAEHSPLPSTYAGGARSLEDLQTVEEMGRGRVDLTIGSALDLFGGSGVRYADCVAFNRRLRGRAANG